MSESNAAVTIVGNPFSGAKDNRARVGGLVDALAARGLATAVVWDRGERAALLADEGWRAGCRTLVIAGGDGTVNDVVNQCRSVPLAILPLGNENLLAKELGFTRPAEAIADAIVRGQTQPLDLASVNGRLYSVMASVGFDADVVHRVAAWRQTATGQRRVSHISYARPTLGSVLGYRFPRIELDADGQTCTGAMAMVFNVSRYATGLDFVPGASAHDGLVDWVLFQRPGRLSLLRYLLAVRMRRHLKLPDVQRGQAKVVTIRGERSVPAQVDGDAVGLTPLVVEAVPDAVRFVVVQ